MRKEESNRNKQRKDILKHTTPRFKQCILDADTETELRTKKEDFHSLRDKNPVNYGINLNFEYY